MKVEKTNLNFVLIILFILGCTAKSIFSYTLTHKPLKVSYAKKENIIVKWHKKKKTNKKSSTAKEFSSVKG